MLTERIVKNAQPDESQYFVWDSRLSGFGLRVSRGGQKAYVLAYRLPDSRTRRETIGRADRLTVKAARDAATARLAAIKAGDIEGTSTAEASQAPASLTVEEAVNRFFSEYAPRRQAAGRMSARTVAEYQRQARAYLLPALGRLRVAAVDRGAVQAMIDPLRPVTGNRVLALTSRMFSYFESEGWRAQSSNPARYIEKAREEARDRVLSPSELGRLNAALDAAEEEHPATVAAVRFAMLTGLRISEVLAVRREHVEAETGRLTIPQSKTGRRVHYLSPAALNVLASSPRTSDTWAFSSTGRAAVTYAHARRLFAGIAKAAGIGDVRLHDLRRTFVTIAASGGATSYALRDLMGWSTDQMAGRYVRAANAAARTAGDSTSAQIAAAMAGTA